MGRDKQSWAASLNSLADAALVREIRRNTSVMSQDMDFWWNEAGTSACIVVGMCRPIGDLVVEGGFKA